MQHQDDESRPVQTSSVIGVNSSNWHRTAIAIVIIALITGTGGYLLGSRNNKSTPLSYLSPSQQPPLIIQHQTTITQPSISPDTVLQTYYNWYLACQNYHFANANVGTVNKSPQEDCPYNKTGLLTSELASTLQQAIALDPVLCAQNRPMEVTYDKAVVINTHATAIVHTVWGASRKQNISVGMDVQNGAWKISSITCPQS